MSNNKLNANRAEEKVLTLFQSMGLIGEIIETKMRMVRIRGRSVLMPDGKKKLGDIFGVMNGTAVLIEVKQTADPTLPHSNMKPHQPKNLDAWNEAGGIAYLAWVHNDEIRVIPWASIRGTFVKNTSLDWEDYRG